MSSTPNSTRAKRTAITRATETALAKNSRTARSMSLAAASKSILPELTLQLNETEQGSAPVVVATAGSESTVCGPVFAIVGVSVVRRTGLTHITVCRWKETDVSKSRIDPKPTTDEHTVATSEPAAGGDSTVCVPPVVQLCGRACRTSYRSHIANCMNAGEERSCVDVSHRAHVHEPRLVSMPQRHRSLRMLPVLLCRSRIPPART